MIAFAIKRIIVTYLAYNLWWVEALVTANTVLCRPPCCCCRHQTPWDGVDGAVAVRAGCCCYSGVGEGVAVVVVVDGGVVVAADGHGGAVVGIAVAVGAWTAAEASNLHWLRLRRPPNGPQRPKQRPMRYRRSDAKSLSSWWRRSVRFVPLTEAEEPKNRPSDKGTSCRHCRRGMDCCWLLGTAVHLSSFLAVVGCIDDL